LGRFVSALAVNGLGLYPVAGPAPRPRAGACRVRMRTRRR